VLTLFVHYFGGVARTLIRYQFESLPITIGQSKENGLSLEDPAKYIGRIHAVIETSGTGFRYSNLGINPSLIGDETVSRGRSAIITSKDVIRLGDYVIEFQVDGQGSDAMLGGVESQDLPGTGSHSREVDQRTQLANCGFAFRCKQNWEGLAPTGCDSLRH
jgi:predicted component of type VI protein secretion system